MQNYGSQNLSEYMGIKTTTPVEISRDIAHLCHKVVPGQTPVYLDLEPAENAEYNECFPNVYSFIEKYGGAIQYGWTIWEWPNVMVEFEFHGVWVSPEGQLKDITPKQTGEQRILFLPDPKRKYEGTSIDNIRFALQDDPVIYHYIEVVKKKNELIIKGKKSNSSKHVTVDKNSFELLEYKQIRLQEEIKRKRYKKISKESKCICGSGKKYKKCCLVDLY